jgi:hypothetical protein
MGYIFPKRNTMFHIFHENVISKYAVPGATYFTVPGFSNNLWSAYAAPSDMSIYELIEGIDCVKRAEEESARRNLPSPPLHAIGIQVLIEDDSRPGGFMFGSKIMLDDPGLWEAIRTRWSDATGEAGQAKPPFLVRLPFCKSPQLPLKYQHH